jgi:hypothetical protein
MVIPVTVACKGIVASPQTKLPVPLRLGAIAAGGQVAPATRAILAAVEEQPPAVGARALPEAAEIALPQQVEGGPGHGAEDGDVYLSRREIEGVAAVSARHDVGGAKRPVGEVPECPKRGRRRHLAARERDAEFLIELPESVQVLRIVASHGRTNGAS